MLIFFIRENVILAFSITWIWLGVGHFNRPGPEAVHLCSENDLEVTFLTALRNHKLQMPSSIFSTTTEKFWKGSFGSSKTGLSARGQDLVKILHNAKLTGRAIRCCHSCIHANCWGEGQHYRGFSKEIFTAGSKKIGIFSDRIFIIL